MRLRMKIAKAWDWNWLTCSIASVLCIGISTCPVVGQTTASTLASQPANPFRQPPVPQVAGQFREGLVPPNMNQANPVMPKQLVKVLFDPSTNRITLVGSKEDIAIVKRTILEFRQKYREQPDIEIVRVSVKFQLAEDVAEILSQSMRLGPDNNSQLKISPLHFPEGILLTGPPPLVQRARKIIETVDSHDYFPTRDSSHPLRSNKATIRKFQ